MGMRRPPYITREPFDFYGTLTGGYTKLLDEAWEAWLDASDGD